MESGPHLLLARHGGGGPALDLPVQIPASPDLDAQAAVIILARVLPHSLRVVPLEARGPELGGLQAGDAQPEPLGPLDIRALVDVDHASEPVRLDADDGKEAQKEPD